MNSVLVSYVIFCLLALSKYYRTCYGETIYDVLDHSAVGDGKEDDSDAFMKAWSASCEDKGTPKLVIPGKKIYLLQPTTFSGPCKSTSIQVEIWGKLLAPSRDAWKKCTDVWLTFQKVTNLTVSGTGEINGQGSSWWRNHYRFSQVTNNTNGKCGPPEALHFRRCDSLTLTGLNLVDPPRSHISIQRCDYANVSFLNIRAPESSPNTDGIDISMSSHVHIHDCNIGTCDDCIAVNNGTFDLHVNNIACGPGHGISVGSLGQEGYSTVEDIHVKNCSFTSTENGARIKTFQGGSGYARKISFEEITLTNAGNPIIIDQYYCPTHNCQNASSCVQVSDVTFSGFQGTSMKEAAIKLECSKTDHCVNVVMSNINITSAVPSEKVTASCSYVNGTSASTEPQVSCLQSLHSISPFFA